MAQDRPIGNMKFGVGFDGLDESINTLDKLNRAIKQTESAMKTNISAMEKGSNSMSDLAQKQRDLTTTTELQAKKVQLLEQRREEYIATYGKESRQVSNVTKQINDASAKYNKYSKELTATKQAYILAESGVDKYTQALKDNEKAMNDEIKAFNSVGDKVGAFNAKQRGLKTQSELTEKAIVAQKNAVDAMTKEFGQASPQVEKAENKLQEFGRQSKIVDAQLDSLSSGVDKAERSMKGFSVVGHAIGTTLGNLASNAISRVTGFIGDMTREAITATDSVSKFKKSMDFAGFGGEEIEKATEQMKGYADTTVYGLEDILNTSAQLASNGIPNYMELTEAAGNLNAVAGGSEETFKSVAMMLTQTAGAGKLTTENWNQLVDAIPGASGLLQEAMLKNGAYTGNFRDAMEKGEISSNEFNQAITQLGMNPGAIEAAKSTDTLGGSWDRLKSTVVNAIQSIIEKIGVENITGFINTLSTKIEEAMPSIANFMGKLGEFAKWIADNRESLTWLVGIIGGITLAIKGLAVASAIFGAISVVAGGLVVALGALVGALVVAYTKSETFRDIVNKAFQTVWNFVKPIIDKLIQGFKDWWTIMSWLWVNISSWASWIGNKFTEMKNSVVNTVINLWNSVKNLFSNGLGDTWNKVAGWAVNVWNKFGELKTNATRAVTDTWTGIKNSFSGGISTVVNWMKDLPHKIASAVSNGKNAVTNAFKGVFNAALRAIGKPVNGIIKGASWVLEKLGAEPLKEWEVPQYATGTPAGGHPINGPMMVNDGRGAETVITPDGRAFIPKGRNVVLNAPKGTHVLTAEETAQLQGSKAPKYRYKKGTNFFGNMWDSVKNVAGNVGNTLKNVVGDVWDFISDPGALARKVLGGLDVLGGLTKYPLEVGKGILSKATSALTEKISGLFSSGNLDTSIGTNGVYKYLADVAKSVMKKFPGFVATSGYRPGDPYSHGKRNAIDIALPGVTGGSPRYTEAANYAFDKFASKIGYVITNGKVRDRSGQSGTGIHNDWRPWPDGDHYDHVHLNGVKDPQNTQISGDSVGGSGVERWRNVAIRALKMTGQYSTANLNALLNQMRTESNGNPNAINNWDINAKNGTPSKGLLQVIDPTFRQYAMPGFNTNIYDPLSNILASIRYALSRYGSLSAAYRGVGYENGGIITKEHIARVGEGNKEEVVIPLTGSGLKRSRAMQLLAYANEKLNRSQSAPVSGTTSSTNSDMAQMLLLLQQQNELLMAILAKDTNVVLDGEKLNSKLQKIQSRNQLNANRDLGLV
ncbi:tail length tape measure protein [Enterococcus phage IME-EFm5]|uniref:Tail length tape-measure protein n=1 Tax=Enterococcus phage IME-EFm5 TaxID=1718158 RepID=A0A0M5M3L4_9CAUD|nr:tail length tape measure protein [Enterococcus phage IME-EFm5]ALF02006.1 tail length tape-measure protein [Enterococcus phage IME-EFm5]